MACKHGNMACRLCAMEEARDEAKHLRKRVEKLERELQAARRQHGSAAQAVGGDIAAGHFKPHPATREWQEVPRHTPGAVILYHAAGWPHAAAEQPAAEQAKAAHVGWRNEKDGRPPAAGNALTEALERVAAYIERRKKSRGLDIEHVHGFDLGPNEGVELLLSDIETIAAHTRASDGLGAVREAVTDYYRALENRQHGGVAQNNAFAKIEEALGMSWSAHREAMQQATSNQQEGAK